MRSLSQSTLDLLRGLDPETKAGVDAIVRRHVTACHLSNTPIESLDRVIIEGIEILRIAKTLPEPEREAYNYEARSYTGTYGSPREF